MRLPPESTHAASPVPGRLGPNAATVRRERRLRPAHRTATLLAAALVTGAGLLLPPACSSSGEAPSPSADPTPLPTELQAYHNAEPGRALRDPELVYETTRFHIDTPAEIHGIQVYFSRVEVETETKLLIWPDFGYNYSSYDVDNPLWDKRVRVKPSDYAKPKDLWFDEPIVLSQPGLVYAGIVREPIEGEPDILQDLSPNAEVDPGTFPQSMVWYPDRGVDQFGFPAIAALPNNLMIGLHIRRTEVEPDPWFEALPDGDAIGLGRVAFADIDNDGDPDLMSGARLFRNDGGSYVDISASAIPDGIGCNGGVFGDYDNDGFADYFCMGNRDRLLRNEGDGTFSDATDASGIDDRSQVNCNGEVELRNLPTEGAAWGDFDGDGFLDLYQANYECGANAVHTPDKLWRNDGDGTFTEVGADLGMDSPTAGRGVNWGDFDNDGDADIFVSNYRLQRNVLWRNDGGRFTDVANAAGVAGTFQGGWWGHTIGSMWEDFDHDGDLDLFSANLAHPRFYDFSDRPEFLENPGDGSEFTSHRDGIGLVFRETSSSPTALDVDNDGDLDLFITNVYDGRPPEVYEWVGPWQLRDRHWHSGLTEWNTWGLAAADVNGDGRVDLAMKQVYRNRGVAGAGNFVRVRLEGLGAGGTNRMAVGARAYVSSGGVTRMREVSAGHGTTCQSEAVLHFGIGEAATADIRVVFPVTGTEISMDGVPANSRVFAHEDGTTSVQ